MPLNPSSWWTPVDIPRPPSDSIEKAAKDVAAALAEYGEKRDGLLDQLFMDYSLLKNCLETARHRNSAIAWAVDEMINKGLVAAVSFTEDKTGRVHKSASAGICSREPLWEWWRSGKTLESVGKATSDPPPNSDDTLTLEEAGLMVHKSRGALRGYSYDKCRGKKRERYLPKPVQTGKPCRYNWMEMKSFLGETYKVKLPESLTEAIAEVTRRSV